METTRYIQILFAITISFSLIGCNGFQSISSTQLLNQEDNSESSIHPGDVVDLETPDEPFEPEEPVEPGPWYKLSKPEKGDSSHKVLSQCTALGERAKKFGINNFIIAFEGLASFNSKSTKKLYAAFENNPEMNSRSMPKKSGSGGFMVYYLLWPVLAQAEGSADFMVFSEKSVKSNQKNSQSEICARAWLQAHPKGKLVLTGHSYGGHAANQLADILKQRGTPIDSVVTVDPRTKGYVGSLGKTSNTDLWINFYQKNTLFLNGYKVGGSENINLSSTGTSHGKIPGRIEVKETLLDILLDNQE